MTELFLSIGTATYNRAHDLSKVFACLCSQTLKNFEWVIVDDGSTDNTEEVVASFQKEDAGFDIRYYKIDHGGKHFAYNRILDEIKGNWFTCVDSDDSLYDENSVKSIYESWQSLTNEAKYNQIWGCMVNQFGKVTPALDNDVLDITPEEYMNIFVRDSGRKNILNAVRVLRSSFAKKFKFPEVRDNLSFFPENIIGVRHAVEGGGNIRFFKKNWYSYTASNSDSVCINAHQNDVMWYQHLYLINDFARYGISEKYKKYVFKRLRWLARTINKRKTFIHTLCSLDRKQDKMIFPIAWMMGLPRYIFDVRNKGYYKDITILGFHFLFKRKNKAQKNLLNKI